ncbi:MAG: PKD domain-containing protein, partial [Bacteroidota bacterium]
MKYRLFCLRRFMICSLILSLGFICSISSLFAQADFTVDVQKGCPPLLVNFQDNSTVSAASWQWDLGGTSSTLQNPGRIFSTPGLYTIRLTITDSSGQQYQVTKNAFIEVFSPPTVNFGSSRSNACIGQPINFQDSTQIGSAPINQWLWDFGDGQVSTSPNPQHTYSTPGSYTITLQVQDTNGCIDLLVRQNAIVISGPNADFSADQTLACNPPLSVQFTSVFTGIGTHFWDFGDGGTSIAANPSHTYNTAGAFTVTHIVQNPIGCRDTVIKTQFINIGQALANIQVSDSTPCVGTQVNFFAGVSNATNIKWKFGDGDSSVVLNPQHTYGQAGTYTVQLTLTLPNNCTVNAQKIIRVLALPPVDFFSLDTLSCEAPHQAQMRPLSPTATQWSWTFGNGAASNLQNPIVPFAQPGAYDVTLIVTDANGCRDTLTKPDYISVGNLTADFRASATGGCAPLTVTFRELDPSPRNNPLRPNNPAAVSWQWFFGTGDTSQQQTPTYTYTQPGSYDVMLVSTSPGGCRDTLFRRAYINIGEKPTAGFTQSIDTSCAETGFTFQDTSMGNITQWDWSFGDGKFSNITNPPHQYDDTGSYQVRLVVADRGCKDTAFGATYVLGPIAEIAVNNGVACGVPATFQFTNLSKLYDRFIWDFGPGFPLDSTTQNPSVTFNSFGTFIIELTVFNDSTGCKFTTDLDVIVDSVVSAYTASPVIGCAPLTVRFNNISQNAAGSIWNFGDGSNSNFQTNPTHTYTQPGAYLPQLASLSNSGCTALSNPVRILALQPEVDFYVQDTTGCAPFQVNFIDTTRTFVPLTSWQWDFGNGQTSSLQDPQATFGPGKYDIKLVITDSAGCTDSITRVQHIHASQPVADFSLGTRVSCRGQNLQFNNLSQGAIVSYLWDFGDGDTSQQVNPTHTYTQNGVYTLSLTVRDTNGCDSTLVLQNYLTIEDAEIELLADTTTSDCPPLLVNFQANGLSSHIFTTFLWDFGDSTQAFQQNVSHLYTYPDTFDVQVIAIALSGCSDTVRLDSLIKIRGPFGQFTFSPDSGCPGLQVDFQATGDRVQTYQWDLGDGTLLSGDTISYVYRDTGVFYPQLILTDSSGCRVFFPADDSIRIFPPPEVAFRYSDTLLCGGGSVFFNDLTQPRNGLVSWLWDYGDGNSDTVANPSHIYGQPGTFPVSLVVTNSQGCADTLVSAVPIVVRPLPEVDILVNDTAGCEPFEVVFSDVSPGTNSSIVSRVWDLDYLGNSSTQVLDTFLYTVADTYNLQLVLRDSFGCQNRATQPIIVWPLPQPDFRADRTNGCAPLSVQFTDLSTPTGQIASWFWNLGNNIFTSAQNPATTYRLPGLYDVSLRVVDNNGCENQVLRPDFIDARNKPAPRVEAGADTVVCLGDSVQLMARAFPDTAQLLWEWTPPRGLSSTTSPGPSTSPPSTTTYFVVAYEPGCPKSIADSITVRVRTLPTLATNRRLEMCEGDSVQLNGLGGGDYDTTATYNFRWFPNQFLTNPLAPEPWASPPRSRDYFLQVTSSFGCESDTGQVRVEVIPRPEVEAGPRDSLCVGDSVQLQGSYSIRPDINTGRVRWEWFPPFTLSDRFALKPWAKPILNSWYVLEAANGACKAKDSVFILVRSGVAVRTEGDQQTVCEGDSLSLQANVSNGATIRWAPSGNLFQPDSASTFGIGDSSRWYTINVADGFCKGVDSVFIQVNPSPEAAFQQVVSGTCEGVQVQLFNESS